VNGIEPDLGEAVRQAIAAQRPGYALSRQFYLDPDIFRHEMQRMILRHWHCVGHAGDIAATGDFFTVEIGGESVIITRGQDGAVRALVNVCRHRGSRVCTETAGHARGGSFTCPYHAWTYGLDGSLRSARQMPESFDRDAHGLKQLQARVIEGLIFISFAENPLSLSHVEEALAGSARVYGWADAKVAHRATFAVKANWKLAVENYMECYHCSPAHQEFARSHVSARPRAQTALRDDGVRRRTAELGVDLREMDHWALLAAPGEEAADSVRSSLWEDYVTGSEDGRPVAPLMGQFTDYDGGITFFDVGPFSNFLAYPDHGMIYRFIPRSVDATDMEVIWLVRGDAREGTDYRLDRLTWLWTVTSIADKRIIELNQQGVNSRYYEPGPYAPMEAHTRRFVDWYLREIG